MKFGSWTYDGFKLDINFYADQQEFDLNDYIESNEWTVLAHPAYKNTKYYPCCVEPFPDLTFHVSLQRRVRTYVTASSPSQTSPSTSRSSVGSVRTSHRRCLPGNMRTTLKYIGHALFSGGDGGCMGSAFTHNVALLFSRDWS